VATSYPHTSIAVLMIIALCTGAGLVAARRIRATTISDFFFAGGMVHWSLVSVALLGSLVWGFVVFEVATTGSVAQGMIWIPLGVLAAGVVLLGAIVTPLRRWAARTLVAHTAERYGRPVGRVVGIVGIVFTVLVRIPLTILVASRVLHASLGWNPLHASLLLVALAGLLVVTRGYVAVLMAYAAAAPLTAITVGGLVIAGIPASFSATVSASLLESIPAPAVVAGSLVLGLWYTCADFGAFQLVIAARDQRAVRLGSFVAAIGLLVLASVVMAAGLDIAMPPASIANETMAVLVGSTILLLALAALSSHYVGVASVVGCDVYHDAKPEKDEGSVLLVSRAVTAVVVISAILSGATLGLMGIERVDWFLRAVVVVAPPLAAVWIIGRYWGRAHGLGALWALSIGWGSGAVWSLLLAESVVSVCFGAAGSFLCTAAVLTVVSLTSAPAATPREEVQRFGGNALRSHRP
jgi:solute:Na+ symporter, SSS family